MLRFAALIVVTVVSMGAAPADRASIRAARDAQNKAIASGDLDRAERFWTDDVTVRRALGQPMSGRKEVRQAFEPPAPLIYQRLTKDVEVSSKFPLAFETGIWEGHQATLTGPVVIGGRYSAQWVKRGERWLIRSEVFVALTCSGVGCDSVGAVRSSGVVIKNAASPLSVCRPS